MTKTIKKIIIGILIVGVIWVCFKVAVVSYYLYQDAWRFSGNELQEITDYTKYKLNEPKEEISEPKEVYSEERSVDFNNPTYDNVMSFCGSEKDIEAVRKFLNRPDAKIIFVKNAMVDEPEYMEGFGWGVKPTWIRIYKDADGINGFYRIDPDGKVSQMTAPLPPGWKNKNCPQATAPLPNEIIGKVEYCTTTCHWFEKSPNYCLLEPTEKYTRKVQIRNLYNGNTIQCYLMEWVNEKSSIMIRHPSGEIVILLIEKAFKQLKGDRISAVGIKYLK